MGDFVFNPLPGTQSFSVLEPSEMLGIGTGFMMIKRQTLLDYQKAYPEFMFKPDHISTEHFDGSREICMFFQAEIDRPFLEKPYREALEKIYRQIRIMLKEIARETLMIADKGLEDCSKRYLSEDYLFCQKARAIGKKVWLCPWMSNQSYRHHDLWWFRGGHGGSWRIRDRRSGDAWKK